MRSVFLATILVLIVHPAHAQSTDNPLARQKIEQDQSQGQNSTPSKPLRDFVVHYPIQAGPASGPNQTRYEFPGIMKLRDGQLLTLYIDELQDPTPPWAASPTCGRLLMARSTDLGRTWSKPILFVDTPIDDRHAYAMQLSNGELLAFFWVQPAALGLIDGCFNYVTVSHDGGRTWTDPVRFRTGRHQGPPPAEPTLAGGCSLTSPPIELPDGSLAMAVHTILPGNRPPIEIGILRSRDHGRTWGDYTTVATDPERRTCFVEPAVVRLTSGKWILVTRTETPINPGTTHPYQQGPTMVCTSTDEGRTWTKPARLPLQFTWSGPGNPFILETRTGVVVFSVSTGTAFSYDEGKTWVPQDIQFGYYPNLLEIEPGTLATLACGMSGKVLSLTRPQPGVAPPAGTPTLSEPGPPPAPMPASASTATLKLTADTGRFRAVRVRTPWDRKMSPLLAQPSLPLLAVARAKTERGPIIAALRRTPQGTWLAPRVVAATSAIDGDPLLVQGRDGTLLCMFPTDTAGKEPMLLTTSRDGGGTWTPAHAMALEGHQAFRMTSPPVEDADGSWLAAVVAASGQRARVGIVRSSDGGRNWRLLAECPSPTGKECWREPSLAFTRDGRWVVLTRRSDSAGGGRSIVVMISRDRGKSWSPPKATGVEGCFPEIVELLDEFFLVQSELDNGELQTAFAWDELSYFLVRNLACGFCVRADQEKFLARGSGIDLAGQYHDLYQVPLEAAEQEAGRREATVRWPVSHSAFHFHGDWKRTEDKQGGVAMTSTASEASVEIVFQGPVAVLTHDRSPDGRLMEVTIDGHEYAPADFLGPAAQALSTCLARNLAPGPHRLTLRPLLGWQHGTMTLRALNVAAIP